MYAIRSYYGDEILVDKSVVMDLCREDIDGNAVSACGNALDPWCSDVRINRRPGEPLYIAIRYDECLSRPVRVQSNGCGSTISNRNSRPQIHPQLPADQSPPARTKRRRRSTPSYNFV